MKDSRPTFPFGWFSALMLLDVGVLLVEKTASTDARGDGIALVLSFLSQPWVWLILVMKLAQLRTWSVLLSRMDLSLAFPLTALAIPITMGAAVVLFGEHLECRVSLGSALITAGAMVIGPAETDEAKAVADGKMVPQQAVE